MEASPLVSGSMSERRKEQESGAVSKKESGVRNECATLSSVLLFFDRRRRRERSSRSALDRITATMAQQPLPELTNVLVSAQSPDAAVRQQAEQALDHLKTSQPSAYLAALAAELGGEQKPAEARQIAGLILKNALDAPSAVQKVRKSDMMGEEGRSTLLERGGGGGGNRWLCSSSSTATMIAAAAATKKQLTPSSSFTSTSQKHHRQAVLAAQWMSLPEEVKAQIRSTLLATLGSQVRISIGVGFFFSATVFFLFLFNALFEPCLSFARILPVFSSSPRSRGDTEKRLEALR